MIHASSLFPRSLKSNTSLDVITDNSNFESNIDFQSGQCKTKLIIRLNAFTNKNKSSSQLTKSGTQAISAGTDNKLYCSSTGDTNSIVLN